MTESREIAEKAFALLQNALEESESERSALKARLDWAPLNTDDPLCQLRELQQQLDQISHERDEWHTAANQLQDVVANERSKQKRLKGKIESLEAGSDKSGKKEINYWRQKAEEFEAHKRSFQHRILELKALVAEYENSQALQNTDEDAENQDAHGQTDESGHSAELERAHALLAERETQITENAAALEGARIQLRTLEDRVEEQNDEIARLGQTIVETENARNEAARAHDSLEAELRDIKIHESGQTEETDELRRELDDRRQQLLDMQSDHERQIAELQVLNDQSQADLHNTINRLQSELADQTETSEQRISELQVSLATTRDQVTELESRFVSLQEHASSLESTITASREQLAGIEEELQNEKTRSDSLNEVANEKREALIQTTEKLEEMNERYEEAKWKLGKAEHFEKLVRRRKKLILKLIGAIKSKQKASNTLKAGLDSLRRYKANADERQQELLRRVEMLESALSEARERLDQANSAKRAQDQAAANNQSATSNPPADSTQAAEQAASAVNTSDTSKLRTQIAAQSEVIENLELDLKSARIAETEARARHADLEKLHDDLETKNTFIGTLQKDIEEQQRNAAQLRKRELEIRELSGLVDERDKRLASLEKENQQLRAVKSGGVATVDREKLQEFEKTISQMSARIKEYEATITTLSDAADRWKRKYDFLAADAPYGFDAAERK